MKISKTDYEIINEVPVFQNIFVKFPLGEGEVDEYAHFSYSDFLRASKLARDEFAELNRQWIGRALAKINLKNKQNG